MKKLSCLILTILIFISSAFSTSAAANYNAEMEPTADIVLLFSLDDGTVLFEKNADKVTAPASLTKITTAVLTIEKCPDLDKKITIPAYCITLLNGTGSSTAGLKAGEEISIRNLLYCLLVKSANDAANVLADYVGGGSIDNFVTMMNSFVTELGCKNTHFVNAHGLDAEGHYTTANDLALITKHAMTLNVFMDICDTYSYKLPATNKNNERNILSTNWLINPNFKTYYYEYIHGIKTGTTTNAGQCIISKASKDGYNYLCIVMGAQPADVNGDGNKDNCAFLECKKLCKWAFENIRLEKIADVSQIVTVVDVALSLDADHVRLVPANDVTALVPTGNGKDSILIQPIKESTPEKVNAPVKKGEVIGKANLLYADKVIATVDLVAAEDVRVNVFLWIFHGVKVVVTSPVFIILVVIAIIIGVSYLYISRKDSKKAKRSAGRSRPVMYSNGERSEKSKAEKANKRKKPDNRHSGKRK